MAEVINLHHLLYPERLATLDAPELAAGALAIGRLCPEILRYKAHWSGYASIRAAGARI